MSNQTSLTSASGAPRAGAGPVAPQAPGTGAQRAYLEHAVVMRRVAMRKFGVPPEDAEALVHDVFINYLATTRTVRSDLRAYLVGAICNACRSYWRARSSEGRVFDGEAPPVEEVLSDRDLFEGVARTMLVAATLARLNARCREVLKRYYLDGEDTPEVAAALETSPGNVNYLMHNCRKRAREIYEQISKVGVD
jgi:RNA polymerase sigma factor (sigma-70 family)